MKLKQWLMLAATGMALATAAAEPPKYNVLFLIADDMRPEMGCYGKDVLTPNLDALAKSGVRFDRAYCQYPLCNPSRASLLTGRQPTETGVLDNRGYFREAHPDWVTLPQLFKNAGYTTLRTGKIFHGGIDDRASWSQGAEAAKAGSKTPLFASDPDAYKRNSDRIVVLPGDGAAHGDFKTCEQAMQFLREHRDQPFFLACGFTKPHSPPTAPQKFFDLYDVEKMPLPPDFAPRPAAPAGFPKDSIGRNGDLFIDRDASPDEAREMIRAYRASVSWVDSLVGRVLGELGRLGLRERTIVVFWGDHGYHLGEKGKWSKHGSLFEVGTRTPFIIAMPGARGNGQACARVVQNLDLYPTLAALAGLKAPADLPGASLVPLLHNPAAPWDKPAFTVAGNARQLFRSVRTEQWRYAEYANGEAMLLDPSADPTEQRNLVNEPVHKDTVAELKALLNRIPEVKPTAIKTKTSNPATTP